MILSAQSAINKNHFLNSKIILLKVQYFQENCLKLAKNS